MTVDDPITATHSAGRPVAGARASARELARRAMWRFAPGYARHRARRATDADAMRRLAAELEHVRERHSEQIERLEDLARELVLAVAALQRDAAREHRGGPR